MAANILKKDLIRILLVEDDKDDQLAFEDIIKANKLPYHYHIAQTVPEAKELLSKNAYDIIISDYYLGNYNAFDILHSFNHIPFVIITGAGDEEVAAKAMREGAYDYLIKDFENNYLKVLQVTIDKAIQKKHLENELVNLAKFPSENPNPVLRIAKEGHIIFANKAAKSMLLKPWGCDVMDKPPDQIYKIFEEVKKTNSVKEVEITCNKFTFSMNFIFVKETKYVNIYATNITERKKAESELKKLSLVASKTTNLVIIADKLGNIIWVNDAFTKTTGYDLNEVIGTNGDFLRGNNEASKKEVQKLRENSLSTKTPITYEMENFKKNGESYWTVTNISPVFDDNGDLLYFVGIDFDITETKKHQQQLEEYAAELERSNNELDDFASITSHDLKEPLRKVKVYSNIMMSKYQDLTNDEMKDYLTKIDESINKIRELIDELLKYSRISSQAQPFIETDLKKVIADVKKDLEVQIDESKGKIIFDDLPTIVAEKTQMHHLFQNIISNALKFQRPGVSPVVQIRYRKIKNNKVEIEIEDNGIGFNEKYVDRIFKPFYRLVAKSEYDGTGMGLAICKKIVDKHGGSINANSIQGKSSKFIITLPVNPR